MALSVRPYVKTDASLKFCAPHLEQIKDDLEQWSKSQYTVVAGPDTRGSFSA